MACSCNSLPSLLSRIWHCLLPLLCHLISFILLSKLYNWIINCHCITLQNRPIRKWSFWKLMPLQTILYHLKQVALSDEWTTCISDYFYENIRSLKARANTLTAKSFTVLAQSVQLSRSVYPSLCDTMDCSKPGFPVHHLLMEPTQTHVHWVSDTLLNSHSINIS